jgi:hypothetical protein
MPGAHFCGSGDHGFGDNHDLRPGHSLDHEDEAAKPKGLGANYLGTSKLDIIIIEIIELQVLEKCQDKKIAGQDASDLISCRRLI